ncbi:MAG: hypothetical protein SOX94_09655 [Prevotella sp.]|nr:hypothetical protein [Prevotella sp.]
MVKKLNYLLVNVVLIGCILCSANATAQPRGTYTKTQSSELGEAIYQGIGSLFKKKDKAKKENKKDVKSKNKSESDTKTVKEQDDIELIVAGDGETKNEATMNALRSALEQTYGTFVSSNTTILNDKLIKDEIVSVSTGNIKEYHYLTENETNNKYYVTLKTVVSVGKLVQYVKSKGGETELAGATFAMNMKMKHLREENQKKAEQNYGSQLELMHEQLNLFDYDIIVGEPKELGGSYKYIEVPFVIGCNVNDNYEKLVQFKKTAFESMTWLHVGDIDYRSPERSKLMRLKDKGERWERTEVSVRDVLKFKIIDNLIEYPFYEYKDLDRSDNVDCEGSAIKQEARPILRVSTPLRKIDKIFYNGVHYVEASHGHFPNETFCIKGKIEHNGKGYDVLISGKLLYRLSELEKISNIRIEPTAKYKEGVCKFKRKFGGWRICDDEVDYLKAGRWFYLSDEDKKMYDDYLKENPNIKMDNKIE